VTEGNTQNAFCIVAEKKDIKIYTYKHLS